ncbi:hypothetical protein U1Q18_039479 [Sarracenia purpurea var. burkii]
MEEVRSFNTEKLIKFLVQHTIQIGDLEITRVQLNWELKEKKEELATAMVEKTKAVDEVEKIYNEGVDEDTESYRRKSPGFKIQFF